MSGARVPDHAASIETPAKILGRIQTQSPMTAAVAGDHIMVAIEIDRDQIRRALGFALIGETEMPRECLRRVRDVLAAIGGAL